MDEPTVGYVSEVLAFAVTAVQFFFPNDVVLIIVGNLCDTHTSVSWSVVGQSLARSQWPMMLRSDMVALKGVDTNVCVTTWVRPIGLAMIAVAAVVTPMGLYESVDMTHDILLVKFDYLAGTSGIRTWTSADSMVKAPLRRKAAIRWVLIKPKG